jgi:hypothetical protein
MSDSSHARSPSTKGTHLSNITSIPSSPK